MRRHNDTNLSEDQRQAISRMSGPELEMLAGFGLPLPRDAYQRLTDWRTNEAARQNAARRRDERRVPVPQEAGNQ